jgi:hypothetical protein
MRRRSATHSESPELNVLGAARVGVSLHNWHFARRLGAPSSRAATGCVRNPRLRVLQAFGSPLLKLQAESGRCNWTRTSDTSANGRSSKDTGLPQHVAEPSDAVAAPRR